MANATVKELNAQDLNHRQAAEGWLGVPNKESEETMKSIQELRLQRWERIRKGGIVKFILIRGLGWIVLMCIAELVMYALGQPRLAWYWMVPAVLFTGLLWDMTRWFVIMRLYARAQKAKNNPN
jgi:hypothetical protein